MRIALIIGVSEYQRTTALPSCKRDADAIEALLNSTGHFEQRLHLSGDLLAQDTKLQIMSFLEKFKDHKVEQVLFYFSGHGAVQDGDLLYLLSDSDEDRPRQTSIENKEIDGWLRELNPGVAIKITDCCHSGTQYIKEGSSIESAMARSKGQFSACYFLAASQADEVTYAGKNLSQFTEHILQGLAQSSLDRIRYKDLADIVLDRYKDNSKQRPYIVQQGALRDIFFEQTEGTRNLLQELVASKDDPQPEQIPEAMPTRRSLTELIEADAKNLLTKETAESCLKGLQQTIESFQVDEELRDIYDIRYEFSRAWEAEIANEEAIGKWISRHGNNLFAEPIEEEIKERVPYHLLDPMEAAIRPLGKVTSKKEITGFRTTAELEYDFIRLSLTPRFPNLVHYESAFVLLWSRSESVLLLYITSLLTTSWDSHQVPEKIKWRVFRFSTPEIRGIDLAVKRSIQEMEKLAKNSLYSRFKPERN